MKLRPSSPRPEHYIIAAPLRWRFKCSIVKTTCETREQFHGNVEGGMSMGAGLY
jgi:hypothetical protein